MCGSVTWSTVPRRPAQVKPMAAIIGGGSDGHYYDWSGKEAEQQDGPVATVKRGVRRLRR